MTLRKKRSQPNLTWPVLGRLSQDEFLSKYWQKRPLLMRGALNPFPDLITPEELAGLTFNDAVESRLIVQGQGRNKWQLKRGPFNAQTFKKLPKKKWTFLVNGVDRFVPSVHSLLDQFSFIPFWRVDDVMISYAVDQGNVGAHVDNFDVFLVQAYGEREWMIEDRPVLQDDFIPNLPIRLLKKFKPTHKWILKPGDILYLPPRFPHHGIARGDRCMTVSVGCRAPSINEIVNGVVSHALTNHDETDRYSDPDLKAQAPGEVSSAAITKIRRALESALSDEVLSDWLGRSITDPYSDVDFAATATKVAPARIASAIKRGAKIVRAEGARLAYVNQSDRLLAFFVNGQRDDLSGRVASLAKELADRIVVPAEVVAPYINDKGCLGLIASLLAGGAIVLEG